MRWVGLLSLLVSVRISICFAHDQRLEWPQEVTWLVAAGCTSLMGQLALSQMEPTDLAELEPGNINRLDRYALGKGSLVAEQISNWGLSLSTVPLVAAYWGSDGSWSAVLTDFVLYLESVGFSSGVNLGVRSLSLRPRPLVFDTLRATSERIKPEASGGFYSGHASGAFMTASFTAHRWQQRNPSSPLTPWVWVAGLTAASIVSWARVEAGKHFPTDVFAGAAIGGVFGYWYSSFRSLHSDRPVSVILLPSYRGLGRIFVWYEV